jgi:hypothetical protein
MYFSIKWLNFLFKFHAQEHLMMILNSVAIIRLVVYLNKLEWCYPSLIFACKAMPGANSLSVGTIRCSTVVVFRLTHKNSTRQKKPAKNKQSCLFVQSVSINKAFIFYFLTEKLANVLSYWFFCSYYIQRNKNSYFWYWWPHCRH